MDTSPLTLRYISKEFCAQFLPPDPTIVEAGSHKGKDALEMARAWPDARIYCFEPNPDLFTKLTENTKKISSIARYPYALSDSSGPSEFYLADGKVDAVSSLLQPGKSFEQRNINFTLSKVSTITIDEWADQNSISRIDFLWLDLQGAELKALQGAKKILPTVTAAHIEANLEARYVGAPVYDELRSFMEHNGFCVAAEAFYQKTWGNVLFVRKKS
jgi:FkbM family methyltransferase